VESVKNSVTLKLKFIKNQEIFYYYKAMKIKLTHPVNVLVVKKNTTESNLVEIYNECITLLLSKDCQVYTEDSDWNHNNTVKFTPNLQSKINLLVTLGGDGTVIWATSLFKDCEIPPVVSFNLGSLGFMARFPPTNVSETLQNILSSEYLTVEKNSLLKYFIQDEEHSYRGICSNEICVDRGSFGNLLEVEIYLEGVFCTTAVGDGLLVATPSGSTAYSLSAGGSIVNYGIPCILITPICPHSLSFRPLVVPDSVKITLKIPENSRMAGFVNIDGREKIRIGLGSVVEIALADHAVSYVILEEGYRNWVGKLRDILGWNDRRRQKILGGRL
jgi:NAD kinase